jgi:hypothetical protein
VAKVVGLNNGGVLFAAPFQPACFIRLPEDSPIGQEQIGKSTGAMDMFATRSGSGSESHSKSEIDSDSE